ncbi:hypothetical protein BQ8482_180123 [Mesorhizobium delmotii]|uniref:Uncharacterized protein n=1 Tax=Mesorhizobium delmotii TaxID=1631247 RepID=A0A2P9AID4_9HYPH|nr:hypothetical protein BQ8482_180123 [Mesorhizobium delmotii]
MPVCADARELALARMGAAASVAAAPRKMRRPITLSFVMLRVLLIAFRLAAMGVRSSRWQT